MPELDENEPMPVIGLEDEYRSEIQVLTEKLAQVMDINGQRRDLISEYKLLVSDYKELSALKSTKILHLNMMKLFLRGQVKRYERGIEQLTQCLVEKTIKIDVSRLT